MFYPEELAENYKPGSIKKGNAELNSFVDTVPHFYAYYVKEWYW